LKQLALAMHNYHDSKGTLPFGSRLAEGDKYHGLEGDWYDDHGWYSSILPYIEQDNVAKITDYVGSFSDPINESARRAKVALFACPSDMGLVENEWGSNTWARLRGNYVVNFGNTNYGQLNNKIDWRTNMKVPFGGAPFTFRKGKRFGEITDGLSNTLMMSECVTIRETGAAWGGPLSDFQTSLGGQAFEAWNTPNSLRADEEARQWPPESALNGIPTPIHVTDTLLQSFAARSKHEGGVNASSCDGSVRFFSNSIDLDVWRALSTAYGGEAIESGNY
jgi:hypothetical protein